MSIGYNEMKEQIDKARKALEDAIRSFDRQIKNADHESAQKLRQQRGYAKNAKQILASGAKIFGTESDAVLVVQWEDVRGTSGSPLSRGQGKLAIKQLTQTLRDMRMREMDREEVDRRIQIPAEESAGANFFGYPLGDKQTQEPEVGSRRTVVPIHRFGDNRLRAFPQALPLLDNMGFDALTEKWHEDIFDDLFAEEEASLDILDIVIPKTCGLIKRIKGWLTSNPSGIARLVLVDPRSKALRQRNREVSSYFGGTTEDYTLLKMLVNENIPDLDEHCGIFLKGKKPHLEFRFINFRPPIALYMSSARTYHGYFLKDSPSIDGIHVGAKAGGAIFESAQLYFDALCDEIDPEPWQDVLDLAKEIKTELDHTEHLAYEIHVHIPHDTEAGLLSDALTGRRWWSHGESIPLPPKEFKGSFVPHTYIDNSIDRLLKELNSVARTLGGIDDSVIVEIEEMLYRNGSGAMNNISKDPTDESVPGLDCIGDASCKPQLPFEVHFIFVNAAGEQERSYALDEECIIKLFEGAAGKVAYELVPFEVRGATRLAFTSLFPNIQGLKDFVDQCERPLRKRIARENLPLTMKVIAERAIFRGTLREYRSLPS